MTEAASLPPTVDADWLRAHRDEVVVADVRWYPDGSSGHDGYLAGHLPGAVWVDLETVLSGPPTSAGGRHPLPDPGHFARELGRLGIGDGATVVAYDDHSGGFAARLVWLLRRTGRSAALLDGGLDAWPHDARQTGGATLPEATLTPVDWPRASFRHSDEVAAALRSGAAVVLDARAAERYSGDQVLPTDPRSGHIPGARNAPWADNLTDQGTFAPTERLRARYAELGVTPGTEVVVHCGSGVTACHDLLALEAAGVAGAALYTGSWSAWSADPERPVSQGAEPGGYPAADGGEH